MDAKNGKGKRGQGKRLTDAERLEVIKVIEEKRKSGREIARDFGVTEGAISKQQQQICKEEINSCLDACDQVRRRLQQLNSAMIKVKCDTSKQTTIRDCFFHKTK